MREGLTGLDGYLADEAYPSNFQREFAPSWIDAMLRHKGLAPPRKARSPFRLMDLGCGDGFGLIALAAAYPEAEFLGIDGLPEHAERGERRARRLGLGNVRFACARFSDVSAPGVADFDYVTGQGLLAWISEENRQHAYRIAAEHLRDGGVACFGYNAMPGWTDMIAFQRMLLLLARSGEGSEFERFSAALEQIRGMRAAGTPALSEWVLEWIDGLVKSLPKGYFAHEYLNEHWEPLWSSRVSGAMARHGFSYLAPGRVDRLREDFCLTRAQRAELAKIADPAARETAADIFARASFRVDIYGRGVAAAMEPGAAQLGGWWASKVGQAGADYSCRTAAGTLRFDNAAAHAILSTLAAGPSTLRSVYEAGEAGTIGDVLNAADALLMAGHVIPAEPPVAASMAEAVNRELGEAMRSGGGMDCLVGPHGAMTIPRKLVLEGAEALQAALVRLGVPAPGDEISGSDLPAVRSAA